MLVPNPEGVRDHGAGFGLLRLTNPLTPDQEALRPTLLPGLIATLRTNLRHTLEDLAFFELARCFFPRPGDLPYERLTLGIALAGLREQRTWHQPPAEVDFYDLKGVVEELLDHCGVRGHTLVRAGSPLGIHPVLHPGRSARLLAADGREIGYFGEIHPALAPTLDLPEHRAYLAELDADLLISLSSDDRQATPISRFPVAKRDIAVVVPDAIEAGALEQAIASAAGDLLAGVRLFDVYHGEQVPAGHKSMAYALTLQAADRTLSDREADEVFARVASHLSRTLGGQVRAASEG
jgi:phenylalanyl-tRNA synthetase beta chain